MSIQQPISFIDGYAGKNGSGLPVTSSPIYESLGGANDPKYFSENWTIIANLKGLNSISGITQLTGTLPTENANYTVLTNIARQSIRDNFKQSIINYVVSEIESFGGTLTPAQISSIPGVLNSLYPNVQTAIDTYANQFVISANPGSGLVSYTDPSSGQTIYYSQYITGTANNSIPLLDGNGGLMSTLVAHFWPFGTASGAQVQQFSDDAIIYNQNFLLTTVQNLTINATADAATIELEYEKSINDYFASYNKTSNLLPGNASAFFNSFKNYVNQSLITLPDIAQLTSVVQNSSNIAGTYTDSLMEMFKNAYANLTGVSSSDLDTEFGNAFTYFLQTYPYTSTGTVGLTSAQSGAAFTLNQYSSDGSTALVGPSDSNAAVNKFFDNWLRFLAPVEPDPLNNQNIIEGKDLYFKIYQAFNPDTIDQNDPDFVQKYNDFITKQKSITLQNTGLTFFIHGQSLLNWYASVQKDYQNNPNGAVPVVFAAITLGTQAHKGAILDRVMTLLSNMVGSLQKIGSAQADQLTFYTSYQQVYNEMLNQIPTFTVRGQAKFSGTNTSDITNRATINDQINSTFSDRVTGFQGVTKNQAQVIQANVNTNSNAVTAQADTASALLQEISTLLHAIFK